MDWRAQLGAALIALLLAALAAVRRRLRKGKPILPRVRFRGYISVRTPSDSPSSAPPSDIEELSEADVEEIDRTTTRPPPRRNKR